MESYDLVIVGSYDSGIRSAVQASSLGIPSALLLQQSTKRPHVSTSAHLLTTTSDLVETLKHLPLQGFSDVSYKLKAKDVLQRLQLPPLHHEESLAFLKQQNVPILAGPLKFVSPSVIEVGERKFHGKHFLLALDASPVIPAIQGLTGSGYYTPETLSDLQAIPKSLIVLGGEPLGIALAQAFARLGSDVIILYQGEHLLEREDTEVALAVQERLKQDGVKLIMNTSVEAVERDGIRTLVYARDKKTNAKTKITGSALLLAAGREVPPELNLEIAGVAFSPFAGVNVDDYLRTTAKHIYAAGDLISCTTASSSVVDSHIATALANILSSKSAKFTLLPRMIPTSPLFSSVGATEQEVIEQGIPYQALKVPVFHDTHSVGEFIKLLVDTRDGKLLGAHLFATSSSDYLPLFTLALQQGLTLNQLVRVPTSPALALSLSSAASLFAQEHPVKSGIVYRLAKTLGF